MAYMDAPGIRHAIHTLADRLRLLQGEQFILVDNPAQYVSRITLNRPEKKNCMNNELRAQLYNQLEINDQDPNVRVTIICGAGDSFCSGYDLTMDRSKPLPMFEAKGDGQFQRNVLAGWFHLMDMAKPIIAQVHGYCLAGGTELAAACDLVYVTNDARIGYPPVKSIGLPDTQIFPWLMGMRASMKLMLTGDAMSGEEAVSTGWANQSFLADEIENKVLEIATNIAKIPSDLQSFNKRSVHRAMEAMGMRTALRMGTDLEALSIHTSSSKEFSRKLQSQRSAARRTPLNILINGPRDLVDALQKEHPHLHQEDFHHKHEQAASDEGQFNDVEDDIVRRLTEALQRDVARSRL